jgi:hypothetical protein
MPNQVGPPLVGGMVHITALALDQFVDQCVYAEVHINQESLHANHRVDDLLTEEVCCRKVGRTALTWPLKILLSGAAHW